MKRLFPFFLMLVVFSIVAIACQTSFDLNQLAQPATGVPTPQAIFITPPPLPTSAAPPVVIGDLRQQEDLLAAIYERVSPGVVAIQTLSETGGGLGSGFVYDREGHIVTNYHVVENATDLEVDFPSGLKVRGKVIGNDLDSDLADQSGRTRRTAHPADARRFRRAQGGADGGCHRQSLWLKLNHDAGHCLRQGAHVRINSRRT